MSPDDYIREFFATIKTYLGEAEIKSSGRHAKYKNSSITASWTDELWNVEMQDDVLGPMKRLYDPSIARSAETAAVSFIDAMRKAAGEEPLEIAIRPGPGRRHPGRRPAAAAAAPATTTTTST